MTSAVKLTYNTVAVFRKTLTILSLLGLLLSVGRVVNATIRKPERAA